MTTEEDTTRAIDPKESSTIWESNTVNTLPHATVPDCVKDLECASSGKVPMIGQHLASSELRRILRKHFEHRTDLCPPSTRMQLVLQSEMSGFHESDSL